MSPDEAWAWITENYALIVWMTDRVCRTYRSADWDDTLQSITLRAFDLLLKFDPSRGMKVSSFVATYGHRKRELPLPPAQEFPVWFAGILENDETAVSYVPSSGAPGANWTWPHPVQEDDLDAIDSRIDADRFGVAVLLEQLTEREQQVVLAHHVLGKTTPEIEADLGISRQRVHQLLRKGMAKLRRQIPLEAVPA